MATTRTHANQQALNRSQLVTQEGTLEERVERLSASARSSAAKCLSMKISLQQLAPPCLLQ